MADLEDAVRLVETLRSRLVPDDYLRRGFGRSYQDLFSALIAVQLGKGQPREALATAERARARALLDLLASRRRAAPDAAPAESSPATFDEIADVASGSVRPSSPTGSARRRPSSGSCTAIARSRPPALP